MIVTMATAPVVLATPVVTVTRMVAAPLLVITRTHINGCRLYVNNTRLHAIARVPGHVNRWPTADTHMDTGLTDTNRPLHVLSLCRPGEPHCGQCQTGGRHKG